MIRWVQVESSAIRQIGYDKKTRRMYIDFRNSLPRYEYCDVPEHIFHDFVAASSVGRFFHYYIKDKYPC